MACASDLTLTNLRHFIQQPLPAEAIRWHLTSQSRRLLPPHTPVELRRSRPLTQCISNNDMIDWAQSTLEPTSCTTRRKITDHSNHPKEEKEVFIARWLNSELSFPLLSFVQERQRRCSVGQNGKRKKQLEIGELLQLARVQRLPVSVESPIESQLTSGNAPGMDRPFIPEPRPVAVSPKERLVHPTTEPSRERLAPVGGTTKILCHASAFVDPLTYVYGGLTQHGCSDSLWSLDPFEGGWRRVVERHERHSIPNGLVPGESAPVQRPCRRYNHTMIGWRHYLVIYGGDGAPGYLDDLWYFDTRLASWDRISLLKEQKSSRPGARAGHSASLWGNQMIVFGGWRGSDGFCDVWSCDLERREWNLLSTHICCLFEAIEGVEVDQSIEGYVLASSERVPFGRHWHVAAVWKDCLYVHGGYGYSGVLKSLWKFDLISHKWELVKTIGTPPVARCRHSGAIVDQGRWILLGGKDALGSYFNDIYIYEFNTSAWQRIDLLCPPSGSQWWNTSEVLREFPTLHCQACAYDVKRGVLIITGGCDGECVSYDSTILIKRSSTASLLFDEWSRHQCPNSHHALPNFIHSHPKPYSNLVLQFL